MHRLRLAAFTIVELLVVITIIVVLLALLTPALDKAVYQAELAKCGAGLHAIGGSVLVYAVDYRRAYPRRPVAAGNGHPGYKISVGTADDRPLLRDHVRLSLNALLNCPLAKAVDLAGSKPETQVHSSYYLWFGFRYRGADTRGMYRMGDRFNWGEDRFNLLASEIDQVNVIDSGGFVQNAHPDDLGITYNLTQQDQDPTTGLNLPAGAYTLSMWTINNARARPRGLTDTNYLYDDASVTRHGGVRMLDDPRMTQVPTYASGPTNWWANLPVR